ncbi:OPT family oligopeptide transporter [Ktedonosporobacter rubrisoli]|uniref:OPT family oligopeptide transporter n=1 Tax=Ktedonosporobacter rubrisoli TaxID=2509675 RepID=A0A4P6JZ93_KTERU|nr:OPT/YSL family transporter [Ktedonosporobacter rubrisoli]QBD80813.1 OPT family oligopeptide transporter [Ktedonosporobacter rubrisoli]
MEDATSRQEKHHPRLLEPVSLILNLLVAVLGAIIGLQLIVTLGVTPNTAIIGAIIAILVSRIPLHIFAKFRSVHRQNLMQTTISGATFGAANALLLPIGIPYLFGRADLVWPTLIGVACAMVVDAVVLFLIFDSRIFPASNAWPAGVATGEAIIAGDKGGRRGLLLVAGTVLGIVGSMLGASMSAFGVAFIGNIWALAMFGIGLLIKGYDKALFHMNIDTLYIPHGIMIGAGVVALFQVIWLLLKRRGNEQEGQAEENTDEALGISRQLTRTSRDVGNAVKWGFVAFLGCAIVLAVGTGLFTHMPLPQFIGWIIFAAIIAMAHELIVGLSAMHAGWFPAFAVALISLIVGMLLGFPPIALVILVAYAASTGPAFADMGYDFKTGWILRAGESQQFELEGRRQQFLSTLAGFVVAVVVVALIQHSYFSKGLIPPVDKVYVATIKAGLSNGGIATSLLIWAIPGALIQLIGGPSRQIGILLATGLLINNPMAGWSVIAGLIIRLIVLKLYGKKAEGPMSILAAGCIAGDALYSFFSSVWKASR